MGPLLGRVVVVAGDDPRLSAAAESALTAGASVAVVSQTLDRATGASVRFNADPRDPGAWERIAMHVEQHLGPVDAVYTDDDSRATVEGVFAADLARRGRDPVVVIGPDGTLPATLPRPEPVGPDQ